MVLVVVALSVAASSLGIELMCFGGGSIGYRKPDFGPLPSLRDNESGADLEPVFKDRKTGQQQRAMLTSMNRSLLMRTGQNG